MGPQNRGVWYKWVAPDEDKIASLDTSDTSFGTVLAVFEGTCGSFSCVQNGYGDLIWEASAGTEYIIFVAGSTTFFNSGGTFTLNISVRTRLFYCS
jgi:hypothetical protein